MTNSSFSIRLPFATLCLVLVSAACSSDAATDNAGEPNGDGVEQTTDPVRQQLAEARQIWAQTGVDTYTVSYAFNCFCPAIDVDVTVADGQITAATKTTDGVAEATDEGYTVEDMFDEIENALDAGAHSVEATYDSATGRPVSFFIDEDDGLADEEFGISESEFLPDGNTVALPAVPMPTVVELPTLPEDFCRTFAFLDGLDDDPETAEDAEAMLAEFVEGTQTLADLAPAELADETAALAAVFVQVDELAAAQDYDPEFVQSDAIVEALGGDFDQEDFADFFDRAQDGCVL